MAVDVRDVTVDRAEPAPGPGGLSATRWLARVSGHAPEASPALFRAYGPTVRLDSPLPGVPTLTLTSSLKGVRDALTDRAAFGKDNPVYVEMGQVLGDGLLTSQGDRWTAQKRTLQPLFTRRRVDGYAAAFDRAAMGVAAGLPDGGTADLDESMRRLTVRAASETLFGFDATDLVAPILADVVVLSELVLRRGASPVPALTRLASDRRLERMRARVEDRIVAVVEQRERRTDLAGDDLVGLLQEAVDPETGARMTAQDVREQAVVFLLAGHETTSTALTFALWELAHRPRLQDAVRTEAREVLGDDPCDAATAGELDLSRRVLLEGMRVHPPVPVTGRSVARDAVVDGHLVRAGETVLTVFSALHRDPVLWPEPDRFDPDRFTAAASAERDPYAHLPFGGGPRACIGNHFAMLEATIALSRLVRDHRLDAPGPSPEVSIGLTMTPSEPVPVRVTDV